MSLFKSEILFIKNKYGNLDFIPLHAPKFNGNEKKYLVDAVDSTFVSSVGEYVNKFESMICSITKTKKAIAVVNGTSGLQVALRLAGVKDGDEVLTQALTFVATVNAIIYNGAIPVFIDVDIDTMGFSPKALEVFLYENAESRDDGCYNKKTGNKISACLPMHTFGFPVHLEELINVCKKWNIVIVEDASESLGSYYKGRPTGCFGKLGVFSFNGNKIVTSGGGGVIVTNDEEMGSLGKHLTTTAKVSHPYEFYHDELGYNFRMPNLNAALACAQLEKIERYLENKRVLSQEYQLFFTSKGIKFRKETTNTKANYWLMCLELENKKERDMFLNETNKYNVMTRPIWQLMFRLPMYKDCQRDEQKNAKFLEDRIVNIPSSVR